MDQLTKKWRKKLIRIKAENNFKIQKTLRKLRNIKKTNKTKKKKISD